VAEPPPVPVAEVPAEILPPPAPLPGVEPGPLTTDPPSESIVILPKPFEPGVPTLFPSGPGDGLVVLASPGSLFEKQIGSQSQPKHEPPREAGRAGDAPLLPPAPPKPGVPPTLYVGGGVSGGSSGGFSALMLAFFAAFLVAAAQSLGGLLPVTLFSPRCTRLAVCLERPD
jgi:hypothetical protein